MEHNRDRHKGREDEISFEAGADWDSKSEGKATSKTGRDERETKEIISTEVRAGGEEWRTVRAGVQSQRRKKRAVCLEVFNTEVRRDVESYD